MTENKNFQNKYKQNFEFTRELVNKLDIYSLISEGAPVDEFDFLTNKILALSFEKTETKEQVQSLYNLLDMHFGEEDFSKMKEPLKTEFQNELEEILLKVKTKLNESQST
jgi:hypothetical protein